MVASSRVAMGTRGTRVCDRCAPARRWNIWSISCPRCGAPTHIEE
jgi:hypothetical protein